MFIDGGVFFLCRFYQKEKFNVGTTKTTLCKPWNTFVMQQVDMPKSHDNFFPDVTVHEVFEMKI